MKETDRTRVDHYLKEVRRGLRGLPAADADDTLAEMRTHILEEIGERGDADTVLADFGDAAEVASEIVERRLRPEDEPPVPTAPVGLRYSAWATDVVVGFGPLVLVPTLISFPFVAVGLLGDGTIAPIWLLLVAQVLTRWVMSPAELAAASAINPTIPAWQWILLAALIGWAAFYWVVLRRQRSASVGMWMTQLRGVRVNDERIVARARDISQHPAPLGAGRNRWWILVIAIPTGCLCILLALYYVSFGVGSFLQPWESWGQPFEERTDYERGMTLAEDFGIAVASGDADAALTLTGGSLEEETNELMTRAAEPGFDRFEVIGETADGRFILSEFLADGGTTKRRDAYLTVEKTEAVAGYDYTESYRICDIELRAALLAEDAIPEE